MIRAVLLAVLVAGCAPYVEISGGYREVNGWGGAVACVATGNEFTTRTYVEYRHCSNPGRGFPVDERFDISHDSVTLNHRWGGRR